MDEQLPAEEDIPHTNSTGDFNPFGLSKWWKSFTDCILEGDNEKIMLMLNEDSIADACDNNRNTLLHYIARTDNEIITDHLISAGCNVNAKNVYEISPLEVAVACNSTKVAKQLLNAGASVHLETIFEWNIPKFMQIENVTCDIYMTLIKCGEDSKDIGKGGYTLVHISVANFSNGDRHSNYEFIKALIEAGEDVNAKSNGTKKTPLHFACLCGYKDVVELLLNTGADVDAADYRNLTPLFYAVYNQQLDVAKLLLEIGADPNWTTDKGMTCSHYATQYLYPELLELLLDSGAEVNAVDRNSNTPLLVSLVKTEVFTSKFYYPAPNSRYYDDDEIIIERFSREKVDKQIECIKILLKHGAALDWNNRPTKLPILNIALISCHSKIVHLLLNYGATFDFDYKSTNAHELLSLPCRSNALHQLLRHTAKLHVQSQNDRLFNFDFNELRKELRDDYAHCRDELELMKVTRLNDQLVSYFNILTDQDIGPYVRNEQVTSAFDICWIKEHFPIYCDMLIERFFTEVEKQELIKAATPSLSRLLSLDSNSFPVIFDNIFRFLNQKDMRNLSVL